MGWTPEEPLKDDVLWRGTEIQALPCAALACDHQGTLTLDLRVPVAVLHFAPWV